MVWMSMWVLGMCGVGALIFAFRLDARFRELSHRLDDLERRLPAGMRNWKVPAKKQHTAASPLSRPAQEAASRPAPPLPVQELLQKSKPHTPTPPPPSHVAETTESTFKPKSGADAANLEMQIGTRWVLIAGVISVTVAFAFFVKYAYDHWTLGPVGKVSCATVAGLIALAAGEISRRRGYDIVARGVTALGFALLYVSIFAAYGLYDLLPSPIAFAMAASITLIAMLYALGVNDVLAAFLSLLGGYLTPVLVSTGRNTPNLLFIYVTILSLGAMFCALYRKWRAINLLAFLGTFLLLGLWRFKLCEDDVFAQILTAGIWLAFFSLVYLSMPLIYGILHRMKTRVEDLVLVVVNAAVCTFLAASLLYNNYRFALLISLIMAAGVHMAMRFVLSRRNPDDSIACQVLLAIACMLVTIAFPLYYRGRTLTMIWAAEAVVLLLTGIAYGNWLTQVFGGFVMALAYLLLLIDVPLHSNGFRLLLNPQFGTWAFVGVCAAAAHLLYRRSRQLDLAVQEGISQLSYILTLAIFAIACLLEWHDHCAWNLGSGYARWYYLSKGYVVIFAVVLLSLAVRPLRPRGRVIDALSMVTAGVGSILTIAAMGKLHLTKDWIWFANTDFVVILTFPVAMAIYHTIWRLRAEKPQRDPLVQMSYVITSLLVLIAVSVEWFSHSGLPEHGEFLYPRGQVVILALFLPLLVIRPVSPKGLGSAITCAFMAAISSLFALLASTFRPDGAFYLFANRDFAAAITFVAGLALAAFILSRRSHEESVLRGFSYAAGFWTVVLLWLLLTIEIYVYWGHRGGENWSFLANMYVSVLWALYAASVMVAGFVLRSRPLRYGALGLFTLLLIKVFLYDTSTVRSVYRIAAFFATGLTLVAVSYLYQYVKKTGFFEQVLSSEATGDK